MFRSLLLFTQQKWIQCTWLECMDIGLYDLDEDKRENVISLRG